MKRTALKRRTPLRQRNPERRAKLHARNFGERADAIRAMPCLACDVELSLGWPGGLTSIRAGMPRGRVQAAHVVARGMGGVRGDRRSLVPLCAAHHGEAGEARTGQREAFQRRYGLDLDAKAEELAVRLDAEGYP